MTNRSYKNLIFTLFVVIEVKRPLLNSNKQNNNKL